jgi:hypothetical protein
MQVSHPVKKAQNQNPIKKVIDYTVKDLISGVRIPGPSLQTWTTFPFCALVFSLVKKKKKRVGTLCYRPSRYFNLCP